MQQKSLRVALVGEPNAGKSTLINAIVGEKVSIVSPKVQTTRNNIIGVVNQDETQLIFIDTPGIFKPERTLEKAIVANAWAGLEDADIACLIIDARRDLNEQMEYFVKKVISKRNDTIIVFNKLDLIKPDSLLAKVEKLQNLGVENVFIISALKGNGIDDLTKCLLKIAKPGPWFYNEDEYTNQSMIDIAAEITREQAFLLLNKEIPYSLKVETEKWERLNNGSVKLYQAIVVLKESQKHIVIGDNGSKIKHISLKARREIEKAIGVKIHLFLYVKVRENWIEKEGVSGS
jgi:GTP-binding protein Era